MSEQLRVSVIPRPRPDQDFRPSIQILGVENPLGLLKQIGPLRGQGSLWQTDLNQNVVPPMHATCGLRPGFTLVRSLGINEFPRLLPGYWIESRGWKNVTIVRLF